VLVVFGNSILRVPRLCVGSLSEKPNSKMLDIAHAAMLGYRAFHFTVRAFL
jgi:hypothetical protein